jgi:hypothetical protein
MRNTLRLPSGPMLISRSRSKEEARLKAGDAGATGAGDILGENGVSFLSDVCRCGFLTSIGASSSSDNCGSSFLLSESN